MQLNVIYVCMYVYVCVMYRSYEPHESLWSVNHLSSLQPVQGFTIHLKYRYLYVCIYVCIDSLTTCSKSFSFKKLYEESPIPFKNDSKY